MSTPVGSTQPGSLSDEEILAAIQRQDGTALAALYDRHGRLAFGLAHRILGERGAAEDVVQEAFLAVWRRASSFRSDRGSARAWLLSIVHNSAIDRRRGRFRHEQTDVALDDLAFMLETDADDAFEEVARLLEAREVRTALQRLSTDQREAIELAYFGGLTQQEIAQRTGAPLGTVKSRMRLGLHRLRGLLEALDPKAESAGLGQPEATA